MAGWPCVFSFAFQEHPVPLVAQWHGGTTAGYGRPGCPPPADTCELPAPSPWLAPAQYLVMTPGLLTL